PRYLTAWPALKGLPERSLLPGRGPVWAWQEARVRPVSAEKVEIGKPLPWSVYDRGGKLLFAQGMVVAGEAHRAIVLERGMVVPESASSGGQMAPSMEEDRKSTRLNSSHV